LPTGPAQLATADRRTVKSIGLLIAPVLRHAQALRKTGRTR
jgi:hypothetical protein